MEHLHATCVAIDGEGVLLRGDPGAGKSDLALRLIDRGAQLIADDYTALDVIEGQLVAHAPQPIQGLMEVRQIGVVTIPQCLASAPVRALFELVTRDRTERLPDPDNVEILGLSLPKFTICAFDASAAAKIRLTLAALKDGRFHDADVPS